MITPTVEQVHERRRGFQRRLPLSIVVVLLMGASVLAPHIGVEAATEFGRSLLPASAFFLAAQAGGPAFGAVTDVDSLASGLNITYYGLSFQHVGLLFGLASFWVIAAPDVGRWVRRFLLFAGWCLALSAPVVITGFSLIEGGGVPAYLGSAWVFALVAGIIMIISAHQAKQRLDSTWYWTKPDWNG